MSPPPYLLLNRASPYQSYITAKRSAKERQKRVDYKYGRLQQCQHNAFPCTQQGEGCILHRLAACMGALTDLKSLMCSTCILMKTCFHAASELEQHDPPLPDTVSSLSAATGPLESPKVGPLRTCAPLPSTARRASRRRELFVTTVSHGIGCSKNYRLEQKNCHPV